MNQETKTSAFRFEKHEITRPAAPEERTDLIIRLLDVMNSIDATEEEAKNTASEFRGIVKGLKKREIGLREHLENGTVTQEVEVHAVYNPQTGMTEYYDRKGVEVEQLRHETSKANRDEEALRRQLDVFGESMNDAGIDSVTLTHTQTGKSVTIGKSTEEQSTSDMNEMGRIYLGADADERTNELAVAADLSTLTERRPGEIHAPDDRVAAEQHGDMFNTSPAGSILSRYELRRDELAEDVAVTDEQPDIRDGINGAVAILTGTDKPLPKVNKKRKKELVTA